MLIKKASEYLSRKKDFSDSTDLHVPRDAIGATSRVEESQVLLSDPLSTRILVDKPETGDVNSKDKPEGPADTASVLRKVQSRINDFEALDRNAEACLDLVTFREPVDMSTVVETLRNYGVAIFPSVLREARLERISRQYEDMIENGAQFAYKVDAREDSTANSFGVWIEREGLPSERFAEVHALFGSETISRITREIFAGQAFDFNSALYAQWTDHTRVPASGTLHWDKQLTLKSWLYVTDGGEGCGAMRAGVGSNKWLRYAREDAMFDGVPLRKIDNSVREEDVPVISTGGPAGTFFLFLTDTAHGAQPVAPGKRRNIIRAQSRPHRVHEWAKWASGL
ncbi:MAG: phytanoyl-CoA dioxygenase family protein [Ruegeria sp.]